MKPTAFYLAILLTLFSGCLNPLESNGISIKVEFPFSAKNVKLHIWGPYSEIISMTETGNGLFIADVAYMDEMIFNISYDLPEYSVNSWWVAAGNTYKGALIPNRFDPHGIKYAKIWINNLPIDNSFVVQNPSGDGLNIAFTIKKNNLIVPLSDNKETFMQIDDRVPAEVHHRFKYKNTSYPLPGDIDIAGWMNAVTGDCQSQNCLIEVDYVRLFGRTGNQLQLLAENEYNQFSANNDGGLYLRYPFFPAGYDQHESMPGNTNSGILTIYPSQSPDKVWHWWTPHYQSFDGFHFDSYVMVCKLRIEGNVIVQAGIDFKDRQNVTHELGCSDWYFENGGTWQDVVFDTKF